MCNANIDSASKYIDTFVTCTSDKDEAKKLLFRDCGNKDKIAAKAAFQRVFLSENGNNKITGQHGVIPFILRQSGNIIPQLCK